MRRRPLLGALLAGGTPLAGCARPVESDSEKTPPEVNEKTPAGESAPDLPVEEVKDVAAAGVEAAPDAVEGPEEFEAALEERGVAVESVSEKPDLLSVHHAVDSFAGGGLAEPLGIVAGVYAAYVGTVDDPVVLAASVLHDGEAVGEYAIPPTWAEEYNAGAITATEYAEKVLKTVKTK